MHSKLFPLLFERLEANRRLTIFDVGPATPETVDFFSRFKCRLYFADLYAEGIVRDPDKDLDEKALQRRFQALLAYPAHTQFDICLFWDFLNYLDRPALHAFSSALQPYVHKDTRGHGFGVFDAKTPLANQQYGIEQIDTLIVTKRGDQRLACHAHSQADLKKLLDCFKISRATLLSDGRLEILLHGASSL